MAITPGPAAPRPDGGDVLLASRRRSGSSGVVISVVSTAAFIGVIVLLVALAPGSRRVAEDFFSPSAMKQAFFGTPTTPAVWKGFVLNIEMFLVAEVLILALALVIAVIRQMPGPAFWPLRMVAIGYTDVFRGIPVLLVIYITGFGVPGLELRGISDQSPIVLGVAALVISYSAYVAEVYRAGIESVHESQVAAARSLGLGRFQTLRLVVLPQAVRRVIPPLLNDFVSLQKDTALVAVLGPIEAARAAQIYGSSTFNYSSFVVAALLFLALTIPLARWTDRLMARDRRRMQAGTA